MTGTGTVKLGKDGKLKGTFRITQGDRSTFIAEKTAAPKHRSPILRAIGSGAIASLLSVRDRVPVGYRPRKAFVTFERLS
jgi:hypothetical protein